MTDTNPRAVIGANCPPDPIDTISAEYEADREEAETWADGAPVENEAQMKAVDALRSTMRQWRLDLERGQKSATAPLHDAYKSELARWSPTIKDAKRIEGCLVSTVDAFKRKLAAERAAVEKAAWEETNRLRREAEDKARQADASNLEAQREVEAARQAAIDAEAVAQAAKRDQVKGLRAVKETVVLDPVALARHLWAHDRDSQLEFQADRARKLGLHIPGVVEIRTERRAR